MNPFADIPKSVPATTAARRISPVDTAGFPVSSTILPACVPFPAPGGPNNTIDPSIEPSINRHD